MIQVIILSIVYGFFVIAGVVYNWEKGWWYRLWTLLAIPVMILALILLYLPLSIFLDEVTR